MLDCFHADKTIPSFKDLLNKIVKRKHSHQLYLSDSQLLLLLLLSIFVNDKGCTEGQACKHAPHKYKVTTDTDTDTKAKK